MGRRSWGAVAVAALALSALAPASAHAVVPGPNGKIAFASDLDGDYEIYTIDPDGTDLFQVTRNTVRDARPSWSPDGARIAFESSRDGNWDIHTIAANGTDEKRVTFAAAEDRDPAWGPGGTRVAFLRDASEDTDTARIVLVDLANGSAVTLTDTQGARSPTWHPDGSTIAYRGYYTIDKISTSGGSSTTIWDAGDRVRESPAYSPDGTRLLWQFWESPSNSALDNDHGFGIFNGSQETSILVIDTGSSGPPYSGGAWSPGGDKIAYGQEAWNPHGSYLHTANVDGTGPLRIFGSPGKFIREPDWGVAPLTPNEEPPPDPQPPPPDPGPKSGACANEWSGTTGKDKSGGSGFGDLLRGLAGNDSLSGGAGDDCLFGDSGDDKLKGGDGKDKLDGGKGKDTLSGGRGKDSLTGGRGNDRLVGDKDRDSFSGGDGNDSIASRDGKAEKVKCGAGKKDKVTADKKDKVSNDCESVKRK